MLASLPCTHAVLYRHVCRRQSCTGLLGPNGAGKTTTISMLTGSLLRTAGVASIGGYDTGTEMDLVYRILGVCPQFDCVWDGTFRWASMGCRRLVPHLLAVCPGCMQT